MRNKDGPNIEKAQKRPKRNKMSTTAHLTNLSNVENPFWAGALVSWLWEETRVLKDVISNPGAIYWMVITLFHIYLF